MVIGLVVVIGSIMVTSAQDSMIISIDSPSDGDTVYSKMIIVSGTAKVIGDQYIDSVTVNDVQAGRDKWSANITLTEGENDITVVATTDTGQSRSEPITVTYQAPTTSPTQTPIDHEAPSAIPTPTPPTGSISITSTPPGAKVYLDDSPTKKNTNITLENVTVRTHKIEVTKKGFGSKTKYKYVRADRTEELDFVLKPLTGSIYVSSTPSGASVYLDDVCKNDTNCTLSEVAEGPHYINLTKSGYFDEPTNKYVSEDGLLVLHVTLTRCGSINISSDPYGADVYLDGKYTGETTPANISKVALVNHTINLTKLGYFNKERKVDVSVAKTYPVHVNLRGYGSINISSDPSGARVHLDGNCKGVTSLYIDKLDVGDYSIRLTKADYKDETQEIQVSAGNTTPVLVLLSPTVWVGQRPWIEKEKEKEKDLLFSLDPRCRPHLKEGDVDEKLKKAFEDEKQSLSPGAEVSIIDGKQWKIMDGKTQYRIEDMGLNIYKK
jgi:hypothetical protein